MERSDLFSGIQAVGWDLDGTLYPSSQALTEYIRRKQEEAVSQKMDWKLPSTKVEYRKRYEALGSNTKTLQSFGIDGMRFFTRVWDEIDLPRYIKKDERVVGLFRQLKRLKHFLISNSNRLDQIEKKLRLVGLDPGLFSPIVSTLKLGAVKPDPEPFLFALKNLSLHPERVLFVGDRVSTDIRGAKGVGMLTCLVWGSSGEADFSLPTVYDVGRLFTAGKGPA